MARKAVDPLSILKASKVLRRLPPKVLRDLASKARFERFDERTLLVQRREAPKQLRFIIAGGIYLSLTTPNGRETRLPPHGAGDWAPWPACFLDDPLPYDSWCLPSSIFLVVPVSKVRAAISKCPEAAMESAAELSKALRALILWTFLADLASDEQRIAQLLFYAARRERDGEEHTGASMTQAEISQLGFGTRQYVSRLLKALEIKGLITRHYGLIRVVSLPALREFAFAVI